MHARKILAPRTIAQAEMRSINRTAVLEYLRLAQTASRTEIADQLALSLPTVKRIIDQLIGIGLVRSTGKKELSKGRSRDLLKLNVQENLVIGIDMGGSHISAALVNIGGEIIAGFRNSIGWTTAEENFIQLVEIIQTTLSRSKKPESKILGIAIGVPGIIEGSSGIVKLAPGLNWVDFPLLQRLEKITDLPILIENDVNLATLGEYWFGAGIGIDSLVMIAIGTGIGAGIILDGKLYRGYTEASGEIGYIIPGIQYLDNLYPGFGALESVASGKGIAERGAKSLGESNDGKPVLYLDTEDVFLAAREGREWAVQIVAETVDYLSLAIANVAVCLDPELIILGGGISGSAEMLIEPIIKRITGVIPRVPTIKASTLKDDAAILGAVVRVFQKFTDYSIYVGS